MDSKSNIVNPSEPPTVTLDPLLYPPSWEQFLLLEEVPLDFEEVQLFNPQIDNQSCLENIGSNLTHDTDSLSRDGIKNVNNWDENVRGGGIPLQSVISSQRGAGSGTCLEQFGLHNGEYKQQVLSNNIEEGYKSNGSINPSVTQKEETASAQKVDKSSTTRLAKRTPKQQQQNKQAQQRYRQRRKLQQECMENTVQLLSERVQRLQEMEKLNQQLLLQQVETNKLLQSKESEIQWLREQFSQVGPSNQNVNVAIDVQNKSQQINNLGFEQVVHVPDSLNQKFYDSVLEIKLFLQQSNILYLHENGSQVPEQILEQCQWLVRRACNICAEILTEDTQHVVGIIHQHVRSNGSFNISQIACQIRLTQHQKLQLSQLRTRQLSRMREIFRQRSKINWDFQQTINDSGLSKQTKEQNDGNNQELFAPSMSQLELLVQQVEKDGFFKNCGYQVKVFRLVKDLQNNVRAEHRCIVELNKVVIQQVFTPVQSAIFMVNLFPSHCDVFPITSPSVLCS